VADVFAEGIEATVPATVRETVDAISALKKHEVSLGELAAKLAPDKSITSRRLRDATDRRYLVNRETRRGRPARIVFGDPMPEMVTLLPESGDLASTAMLAWRRPRPIRSSGQSGDQRRRHDRASIQALVVMPH
jgi:hypothetical protein